ncbi:MAG: WD40 repeat domain-containing protein, partial [Pirellulaceae bacterium]
NFVFMPTRRTCVSPLTHGIECLAFSPSGKWLVSGSDDYSAAIWDVVTKELVHRLQHRFDMRRAKVTGVAFSSDGKTLATSIRESRKSSLWRVETGELLGTHEEHPEVLLGLARPRGRNEIVTACKDGVTRIVDLSTGKIIGKCLGHTNRVWDVATSRNGDELATASADGTVMLWDLDAVERSRHSWSLPRADMDISFSPDGTSFGASTNPGRFYLWDTTTNALTWKKPTEASPSDSFACARFVFGPEGKSIAIGDSELPTVEVWDLPSGKRRLVIDCKAYVLAWHPSRSELATVEPLHVKFWDTNTGKQIGQIDTSNDSVPMHIEYSPDGRLLATRDRTFSVGAWRTDTRELISSVADTSTFYRWAFSPDGKILALGRSNSQILLWNLPENRALGTLVGHKGDISDLVFSRDGNTLASAASDDGVRIWDMRTQQEVMHWPVLFPVRIAFPPTGKTLVVVSREGDAKSSLRIFSADSDEDAAFPPFSPEAP